MAAYEAHTYETVVSNTFHIFNSKFKNQSVTKQLFG